MRTRPDDPDELSPAITHVEALVEACGRVGLLARSSDGDFVPRWASRAFGFVWKRLGCLPSADEAERVLRAFLDVPGALDALKAMVRSGAHIDETIAYAISIGAIDE